MTANKVLRLLETGRRSAEENSALDRFLTQQFSERKTPTLRIYSWEKSYTVGLSQSLEEYTHLNSFSNSCAKRITGGGVLFHGHDVSYSIIIPTDFWGELNVKETYEKICSFLILFYKKLGLNAHFAKDSKQFEPEKSPFCQSGTELYDIVINDVKIGGNAQRRTKDFIFQHGSIPILKPDTTDCSLSLGKSLKELGVEVTFSDAPLKLVKAFDECFDFQLEPSELSTKELELFSQFLKEQ